MEAAALYAVASLANELVVLVMGGRTRLLGLVASTMNALLLTLVLYAVGSCTSCA